ncbi:nicotinamide riboside transporter PnuC [Shewanella yunxiaonensis]|uniref:Nicotinamide riboside transporter PnuC n=1 Tax=Shewanella yunxiaonensis TaxID=2829809 RepID=A0ABX7YTT4_9GAMM|nr:nicotinamide riboside transporter PnuC [Shewanella yunxiaonensis]QUN05531.1 nicotinamide riboside transporter PnuC [Shewanella yunxiaonensis]
MDIVSWFDINNTVVNIPIGSGYAMSWIEAIGTIFGLLCIWYASQEKTINYLFGLINVTLFAVIFFQIQLYGLLLLQVFFFCANVYGWYAWTHPAGSQGEALQVRWLARNKLMLTLLLVIVAVSLLTLYIDAVFFTLASWCVAALNFLGLTVQLPSLQPDPFPLWDAMVTVLSVVAQLLMTRKYVENWILWVLINVISVGIYAAQGVYAMSIEYTILLFIAANGTRAWVKTAKYNGSRHAFAQEGAI